MWHSKKKKCVVSSVAQRDSTLLAVPRGVYPSSLELTSFILSPLVFGSLVGVVRRKCCGKVLKKKRAYHSQTPARSAPAAELSNEFFGQLQLKLMDGFVRRRVFLQDEGIRNCHIQEKVKNIFIKLSALCSVVSSNLIPSINSSHAGVVVNDGLRTRNLCPKAIFFGAEELYRL